MKLLGNGWMRLWIVASLAWMLGYVWMKQNDLQRDWNVGVWAGTKPIECFDGDGTEICKLAWEKKKSREAANRSEHLQFIIGLPFVVLLAGCGAAWVAQGFRGKK